MKLSRFASALLASATLLTAGVSLSQTSVQAAAPAVTTVAAPKVVNINYQSGYSIAVWNSYTADRKATGLTLKHGTSWKVLQAVKVGTTTFYKLGNNQWIDARYATTAPVGIAVNHPAKVYVNYKPGYSIAVWTTYANGRRATSQTLKHGTAWKVNSAVTYNGQLWYNLGKNQWIQAAYTSTVKPLEIVAKPAQVYVNYQPGYSIAVWTKPTADRKLTGLTLKHGTAWKVIQAVKVDNKVWYALGTNQWIQATYTSTTRPQAFHYNGNWRQPSQPGVAYPNLKAHPNAYFDVSIKDQRVYVKDGNQVLYTMITSTGLNNSTPRGTFAIQAERGNSFFNPSIGGGANYWTSFLNHGVYLFHSVPTGAYGQYLPGEAAKLGSPASHGCVRLPIPDAIWIMNNAPVGMKVVIH